MMSLSISYSQDVTCNTDSCIIAAGEILALMNMNAKPCEDFYNYACGGFVEKRFLRPSQEKVTQFSTMSEDNSKVVYRVSLKLTC